MLNVGNTIALSDATQNGVWSSGDNSIATIDANGIVTGVNTGSVTIQYTVTYTAGVSSSASFNITVVHVNILKAQIDSSNKSVCLNAVIVPFSVIATGSVDNNFTYKWYKNTVASNSHGTLISGATLSSYMPLTTVANTTYYYCIVKNSNGDTAVSNISGAITINSLTTVAAITGTTTLCAGKTVTLRDANIAGVWSSSDNTIATVSSTGVVTGVSDGTDTIRYTVTNSSGCSSSVFKLV